MITPHQVNQQLGLDGIVSLLDRQIVAEVKDQRLRMLERDLREGRHFQLINLELSRRRLGVANRVIHQAHINGIGRLKARILPEDAAELRTKYGQGCLHDPDFINDTIKKNPYMQVNCAAPRTTVLVNGLRDAAGHGIQGEPGAPPVRSNGLSPDVAKGHGTASGIPDPVK